MSNDNRKPMSPIGQALFDMMTDMGRAQAKIYTAQGCTQGSMDAAQLEVIRLQRLHQPKVLNAIRRQGDA